MSYILDALRRLEQDKEKARKPANPLQTVLHAGPEIDLRFRKPGKPLWPWILTGLLVFLVAAGITFWIGRITAPELQYGPEPSVALKVPPVTEAFPLPGRFTRERRPAGKVAEPRSEVGRPSASSTDNPADLPPGEPLVALKVPPVTEAFPMAGRFTGERGPTGKVAEPRSDVGSPPGAVPDIPHVSRPPRPLSRDVPPPAPEDPEETFPSTTTRDSPVDAEPAWETLKSAADPSPETLSVIREETSPQERLEPKEKRGGAVDRTEQEETEEELAPAPRLTGSESGIRISAIVWSPNRDKRFAIVNMKTVHAGDPVDGNTVVDILEDAVVFEKDGTRFSVGMHGH